MNKAPAFQFYADDFLGGVADMTQAEIGAYIMLLCAQWNRGAIPTDPNRAALIAKGEVTPHVLAKFPDGKNPRLEAVRAEQEAYRELQAEKGRASARARLNRGSTAVQPKGQPKANPPSPSPTPISILSNERIEAGSASPTGKRLDKPKRQSAPKETDAEWMAGLAKLDAYSHINIPAEWQKMEVWSRTRNVTPSRRRFVNWLNNVPAPMRAAGSGRTPERAAEIARVLGYQEGL